MTSDSVNKGQGRRIDEEITVTINLLVCFSGWWTTDQGLPGVVVESTVEMDNEAQSLCG